MAVVPFDLPYLKPHAARKLHGSIFYETEITAHWCFTWTFQVPFLST